MDFFKNIGNKIKAIVGVIAAILGFFLFFSVRQKILAKQSLQFQLDDLRNQMELEKIKEQSHEKENNLHDLKEQEAEIRKKIDIVNKKEAEFNRDISLEELDAFYDEWLND